MKAPFPDWNVSRETYERLTAYHDLVLKWSPKINLISKSSIPDLWERHIWDSAQVVDIAPKTGSWVDIGSGGGFPGIVAAIFSKESTPERVVTMIESDHRKAAFLRTVVRELRLNAQVLVKRVEAATPQNADILSARALSDLSHLLEFAKRHLNPNGVALFPKGETWEKEVNAASESWSFHCNAHTSRTNPRAAILEIRDIERV